MLLFVAFFVTAFVVMIVFAPSYFIIEAALLFKDRRPVKEVFFPFVVLPAVYLLFFFTLSFFGALNLYWLLAIGFLGTVLVCLLFPSVKDSMAVRIDAALRLVEDRCLFWVLVFLSGFWALGSLVLLVTISISRAHMTPPEMFLIVVCLLIGYLPGLLFLRLKVSGKSALHIWKMTFTGFFIFWFLFVVFSFSSIQSLVFRSTGVYSLNQEYFQLIKPDYAPSLIEAELVPQQGRGRFDTDRIISAYTRYHFGGVRLLCDQPFYPGMGDSLNNRYAAKGNCVSFDETDIKEIYRQENTVDKTDAAADDGASASMP